MKSRLTALLWAAVMIGSQQTSVAAETGRATLARGETTYEFVVIQCLRNIPAAFGDTVIEFQLDGVPPATPPDQITALRGLVGDSNNLQQALMQVVAHGPVLSITRIENGGEMIAVTDMADILWASDGNPGQESSRTLSIEQTSAGTRVRGTTHMDGDPVTIEASCPD